MKTTESEERRYLELLSLSFDCARSGDTVTLARMIESGLPVDLRDEKGNTFLMLSTYHGHPETSRKLLALGADPDGCNDRGQTPLGGVAFKGYAAIAQLLLERGAAVDADQGGGQTPLMFAEMFGRDEVAAVLRSHGADAARRTKWGLTADHWSRIGRGVRRIASMFRPRRSAAAH